MTDKFISFENESPEFIDYLRSLKEKGLKTSAIILKLLEKEGGLFSITNKKKKDLEDFKKLINIKVPEKDKAIILDKINELAIVLFDEVVDATITIKVGWNEEDFSEEENIKMRKKMAYYAALKFICEHHKIDTFFLFTSEDPNTVTLETLDFTDIVLDFLGIDSELFINQNELASKLDYMFLVFHPEEKLPGNSSEAIQNLIDLGILDSNGNKTDKLWETLEFIRDYWQTSFFNHKNLVRFLKGNHLKTEKEKEHKLIKQRILELKKKGYSQREIFRKIGIENFENNWLSEQEVVIILKEILRPTNRTYTASQEKWMTETGKLLEINLSDARSIAKKIREYLSVFHTKRLTPYWWEDQFIANLRDLQILEPQQSKLPQERWFTALDYIKKHHLDENYSFESLRKYMRRKYPDNKFELRKEKALLKLIADLDKKEIPKYQWFMILFLASEERLALPSFYLSQMKGCCEAIRDGFEERKEFRGFDLLLQSLKVMDEIGEYFEGLKSGIERIKEKLNTVSQKKKLSARAKQKLKKRKRKK